MAGNPKTLVVVRGEDSFEFFFEGDNKYWRTRDHPDYPGFFLVEEYLDGWYSNEFYDSYENAGVEGLQGLFRALVEDPERTLEGLLGEKLEVKEVRVEEVEE